MTVVKFKLKNLELREEVIDGGNVLKNDFKCDGCLQLKFVGSTDQN